jgi:biopolymer transport protein ExbB/TolQ
MIAPCSLASFAAVNGLWFGFKQSSLTGIIICVILLGLSIFSWTAVISKLNLLKRSLAANQEFLHVFRHAPHPLAIFQSRERFEASPCYHVYHFAAQELAFHLLGVDQPDQTFLARIKGAGRISPSQMAAVQVVMDRAAAEATLKFESRLSVVAMALSGAPFIGLLGTVWGVMDSFAAMAEAPGRLSIQAMAPGICSALITTVVGLLVAIPSMFGYNISVSRIRAMVVKLDNFASELSSAFDRHYVEHNNAQVFDAAALLNRETVPTALATPTPAVMDSPMSLPPMQVEDYPAMSTAPILT